MKINNATKLNRKFAVAEWRGLRFSFGFGVVGKLKIVTAKPSQPN
jgi:hypothetical protein